MKTQGWFRKGLCILLIIQVLVVIPGFGVTSPQGRYLTFMKGDAIRLTIWQPWRLADGKAQISNLNGDYPIDSRGYTLLPLIGEVKVVGHNIKSLTTLLKEKYSPYIQDPYIVVTPLIRVTMQGAVNRPGAYLIPPSASLWELVDLAGGPSEKSNIRRMYVERSGRIANKNLLGSFEKGYSLQEIGINSGDQILVPSRNPFGWRDVLSLVSFGLSIAVVYFQITK
jgi:polysaccharide export outer membrane protein